MKNIDQIKIISPTIKEIIIIIMYVVLLHMKNIKKSSI